MVFEKVTLSRAKRKGSSDEVVKIGFLNIATNQWITINDQGIVTLQVKFQKFSDYDSAFSIEFWLFV